MGQLCSLDDWSTDDNVPREQYDAWVGKLNDTFGTWHATRSTSDTFRANVRANALPGLSLVECICDPCGGSRSRADADNTDTEQLAIQLVVSGREHMRLGEQEAVLGQGDIFVWDNTQPMSFSVLEPLHKISLILPLQRLKDWEPNNWRNIPRWMRKDEPGTELLANYIRSLSGVDYQSNPLRYNALVEAAVALLVASQPQVSSDASQRQGQLEVVKSRIRQRLRDPDLDLAAIAQANRISLRYLHWLFAATDSTPWRFIVDERLDGCRRDLANPGLTAKSITEIAFSWGFSNVSHFGRKFKSRFDLTPTEMRELSV